VRVIRIFLIINISIFFFLFFLSKVASIHSSFSPTQQTGFKFPTTCQTTGSSCENLRAEDDQYNSWEQYSRKEIVATFEGFSVPDNAIISSIEIKTRMRSSLSFTRWEAVASYDSGNSYVLYVTSTPYYPDTVFNTGYMSWQRLRYYDDTFGILTGKDINSGKFRLKVRSVSTGEATDIDTMSFNIFYNLPDVPPTQTPTPTSVPTPTPPSPFLDLPWNYEGKGETFNEAALAVTSYFDHEYPLLSASLVLQEPRDALNTIVNYKGFPRIDKPYSSHDGYDYARLANVHLGDPVLAAAGGIATYVNSCGACGNMIVIDHQNGYQTRYLHLQRDGLITNIPNKKTEVNARQVIGKVGFTGNVNPQGEDGAHIHFGVFQDKNKDGNFDDNIPDGVTDPFGWQSTDPDPWEGYSFFYTGQQRTGNKSYYLWKKKLDGLKEGLSSNGGVFDSGRFKIDVPKDAINQNATIEMKSEPQAKASETVESIGSILNVFLKDPLGNLITLLTKPMTIGIDFSKADLSRFKLGTISIYSSTDGTHWQKENTFVDFLNKKATAEVNHLTLFAFMGERADTTAATTEAQLVGLQGQQNRFRSDVQLALNAKDNENGSGVDYIAYIRDGGDWETYTAPLNFTNEGHYKISYYSADRDGNIEDTKTVEFDIDKTPPEAEIRYDLSKFTIQVTGKDSSGSALVSINSISSKRPKYIITDQAGNILQMSTMNLSVGKQALFGLDSLQYNTSPSIILEKNLYGVLVGIVNDKSIKQLDQFFAIKGDKIIIMNYTNRTNTTTISVKTQGNKFVKEQKRGIDLLQLNTQNGTLKYTY